MGRGNLLRRIGLIYFDKKAYQTALNYHKQAEKLLIAEKEPSYTGYAWLNLAQDYKALKQNDKVIPEALKAFEVGKKRELPGLIIPSATLLAEVYTTQKDFEKALYYTKEVLNAKEIIAKISKEDVLNNLIAKYELREKNERIATLNYENNLKNEVLKAQKTQIFTGTGIVFLLIVLGGVLFVNYSRKLKINALLSQQKEELQTLNQVKDRLFSVISHDLRSPINDLFLFLQLNPKRVDTSKMIPTLSNKVFQVQHLLDNLLQWSVTQMKGIKPTLKHIEVYDLVEEICNLYQYITDNQEVIVENQISQNAVAFCDENMLRFVLRNVFTNALKFTPSGKKVIFSAVESENEIEITVQDEGMGMNKSTLVNLFSPNINSNAGIRGEQGTGLGLMLCKEYVEKNEGKMAIESQEGIGTSVKITLKS
jgi:signal transduction histidine kinase